MDFIERIKELYLKDSRGEFNFKDKSREHNPNRLFNALSHQNIERVIDLDFSTGKKNIIELCKYVPPKLLLKEFGEEMVCWMFLHNPERNNYYLQLERMVKDSPHNEEMIDAFLQLKYLTENKTKYFLKNTGSFLKGKDATAITKAIRIANTFDGREKFKFIQQNYFLIEGLLQQNILQQMDWRQLLENQFRQNIPNLKRRLDNYSLESLFVDIGFEGSDPKWMDKKQKNTEMVFRIYLDAPLGIILKYRDEPQAVAAFTPINENTIKIYQLQGVVPKKVDYDEDNVVARGNSRGLSSFNWQAFFIDVVADLAKRYNFREIVVQSGYNNEWIKQWGEEDQIHLPLDVALQKYDVVAERLGFTQREDKNWYRKIKV